MQADVTTPSQSCGSGPVISATGVAGLAETPKTGTNPTQFHRTMSLDSALASSSPVTPTKVRSYFRWSLEEEDELRRAVDQFGRKDWELIRVCPDFPLLSGRSSTMLKNKWYKMMRGEKRREDENAEGDDSMSSDTVATDISMLKSKSKIPLSYPAHIRGKEFIAHRKRPSDSLLSCHDILRTESSLFASDREQTVESPSGNPLASASQKLSDSLSMMREALAIQVDANKAVASAVAARDAGGDEELVRTAMYVASLAQTKAKKAREYVAQARKYHAEVLATQTFADSYLSNEDDSQLIDLMDFLQQQQDGTVLPNNEEARTLTHANDSHDTIMPDSVISQPEILPRPSDKLPLCNAMPSEAGDSNEQSSEPVITDIPEHDDAAIPATDNDVFSAFWEPSLW